MDGSVTIETIHSFRHWTDYLDALLVPVIAIAGVVIAFLQWKINKDRYKHELFDRRYEKYEVLSGFLSSIMGAGNVKPGEEFEYLNNMKGARFLFGPEIVEYLEKTIWPLVTELVCINDELKGYGVGPERKFRASRRREILSKLMEELTELDEKFAKYMSL